MIKQKLIDFTREPISLIVLLIFLFAGDVLVKLCVYAHLEFHNYSAITRGLFFLVSILMAFINPTPFRKKTTFSEFSSVYILVCAHGFCFSKHHFFNIHMVLVDSDVPGGYLHVPGGVLQYEIYTAVYY